jgi:hypothetical protein
VKTNESINQDQISCASVTNNLKDFFTAKHNLFSFVLALLSAVLSPRARLKDQSLMGKWHALEKRMLPRPDVGNQRLQRREDGVTTPWPEPVI